MWMHGNFSNFIDLSGDGPPGGIILKSHPEALYLLQEQVHQTNYSHSGTDSNEITEILLRILYQLYSDCHHVSYAGFFFCRFTNL